MFLKLQHVWEPSEALNERADFDSSGLGCSLGFCISGKLPGDTDVARI